jgi:SpoVK/Ycf46/Vps4 family AAA+-type ATPase
MQTQQRVVFRHRFWESVHRELSMGNRHFVLEGAIDDWFYNHYLGTQGLLRTLCLQLTLNKHYKVNRVLHLSTGNRVAQLTDLVTSYDRPSLCAKRGLRFSSATFQHFEHALTKIRGRTTVLLPGEPATESPSAVSSSGNFTSRTGNSAYRECLESLPILAGNATQNIAFVMSEFATSSGLYPSLGPDVGAYIQALDAVWRCDSNLLTFLVIDDAGPLREHFFPKLDERVAVVPIGRPGIDEILRATRRRELNALTAHESYKVLSTVLSNEKKTLRESLQFFSGLEMDSFDEPSELRSRLISKLDVSIDYQSWDDVVISEQIKKHIRSVISDFQHSVAGRQAPSTRGILFHGPPGTGKTLLAKVIAAEEGMSFFSLTRLRQKSDGYLMLQQRRAHQLFSWMRLTACFHREVTAWLMDSHVML